MYVRDKVFVVEQHCSAAAEIDEDDPRSWEWVVYAQRPHEKEGEDEKQESSREEVPVGVIRLVPPPHAPHANNHNHNDISQPKFDYDHEPYIKITRVAVLKEFRGHGLSRLLMKVVEDWAQRNKESIDRMYTEIVHADLASNEHKNADGRDEILSASKGKGWNGLIGLHAQVQVEKMYQGLGYETDISMGKWDEEGIEHIGMFKRLDVH